MLEVKTMNKNECLNALAKMVEREEQVPGITNEIMQIMILGGKAIRKEEVKKKLNENAEMIFKNFLEEHEFDEFLVSYAIADTTTKFIDNDKINETQGYEFYSDVMLKLLGENAFTNDRYIYDMQYFKPESLKRKNKINYLSDFINF